jgi:uncharacterized membrane-anchored protein
MKFFFFLAASLALIFPAFAADAEPTPEQLAAFQKKIKTLSELKYQDGVITLAGGKAKISLTADFQYLDRAEARKVLGDLWENPASVSNETDGMIVPKGMNLLAEDSWGAIVKWTEEGYVKDEEFSSINFNDMLKELKEGSKEASKERVKQGFGKLEVVGWAEPPHYDKGTHKLYWAKSLDVDAPVQGLNYDIRALGRAGVLEVSIISSMPHLKDIGAKAPTILSMVDFTDGNRYADYKKGDNVAAYGIAGLIAGGVLLKTGFFKGILLLLVKLWKPVAIGVVAIGAWIKNLLGRRKQL